MHRDRGAWLHIAALCGGVGHHHAPRRHPHRRLGFGRRFGLVHVYAYAYHAGWLGPAGVLSNHFLILSCWSFICMFAVVPFFTCSMSKDLGQLLRMLRRDQRPFQQTDWMVTDVPAHSQRALTIFAVAALKYARLIGRLDGHRGIGRKGVRCSTCR